MPIAEYYTLAEGAFVDFFAILGSRSQVPMTFQTQQRLYNDTT